MTDYIRIFLIGALPSSLYNFRGELIKALKRNGNEVIALASGADTSDLLVINKLVDSYIDYPVSRNGLNPLKDLKTLAYSIKILDVRDATLSELSAADSCYTGCGCC